MAGRLALLQQHRVAQHRGERIIDLVRDLRRHDADRREPVAARQRRLQRRALGDPARHLVDPLAEHADLARAAHRRRIAGRARGDRVGVARQRGERAGQPGREEPAERERQGERRAADEQRVARGLAGDHVGVARGLLVEDRPARAAPRLVARQVAVRADPAVRGQRAAGARRQRAIDRRIDAGEPARRRARTRRIGRGHELAGAIDDDHPRAGPERGARDHGAHEPEIEAGDERAHQLTGAAAGLDDEVDDRPAGLVRGVADVAAEAVVADVELGRHRIADPQRAVRIDDRECVDHRHAAAQPAEQQLGLPDIARRVGPRAGRELDGAPRVLQGVVERGAERVDVGERAAVDLVAHAVARPEHRERADHHGRHRRRERDHEQHAPAQRAGHHGRACDAPARARSISRCQPRATPAAASSALASPAAAAASAALRSSNNSGVTGSRGSIVASPSAA